LHHTRIVHLADSGGQSMRLMRQTRIFPEPVTITTL
jgi:hypothetical protein